MRPTCSPHVGPSETTRWQAVCLSIGQLTDKTKNRELQRCRDQASFFLGRIGKLPADYACVSRLRANRSRLLKNLAMQRSRVPLAARSAGLPRDRARKPAQDAAWRNRERAGEDVSDGRKTSLTRPCFKDPSTRKRHTLVRPQVLDGAGQRVTPYRRQPASEDLLRPNTRPSMLGKSDQHSCEARRLGMGHGGVDTAHPGC